MCFQPESSLADEAPSKLESEVRLIRTFYEQVEKMAEWPFNAMTLARMVFPLAAPFLPTVIANILTVYIK